MNPETDQQPQQSKLQQISGSIKQTISRTVGSFIKKGVKEGAKKAATWATTTLLSALAVADPEPITKVVLAAVDVAVTFATAVGKFVWDNVFKKVLIELKRKPLHTFVAGMSLITLPGMIAMPAGIMVASQAGGAFLTANGAINGLFGSGGSFGKGVLNLALKPVEFVSDIIAGLGAAEISALPAMVGVSSSVLAGGFVGIMTVGTLAAAFYVPTVSRLSTLAPRSEYFKIEKFGSYEEPYDTVVESLRTRNQFDNGEIRAGGRFAYSVTISPSQTNATIDWDSIRVEDALYYYRESGVDGPYGHEGSLAEQDYSYAIQGNSLTFTYYLEVKDQANFEDVMISNHVTVTASVVVEEDGERRVEGNQVASDSLNVIIGDVPNECPRGWPINTNPIRVTQGPLGSYSHSTSEAIDLGAPLGTPVYSTTKGYAKTFYSNSGYGNHVVVTSQCQGVSLDVTYAHLHDIPVTDGQLVEWGQKVGEVGSTGNSTGYHLHYQFDPSNGPIQMKPSYVPAIIPRGDICNQDNVCEF